MPSKMQRFPYGPAGDIRQQLAPIATRKRHVAGGLAYDARISRSYLSPLEKGSVYVSIKVIGKLAETLAVEPEEFLKRPNKRRDR